MSATFTSVRVFTASRAMGSVPSGYPDARIYGPVEVLEQLVGPENVLPENVPFEEELYAMTDALEVFDVYYNKGELNMHNKRD